MVSAYFLIAQITGILVMIFAVLFFTVMINSWSKDEKSSKRAMYIIITSFLWALAITLILYGFRFF